MQEQLIADILDVSRIVTGKLRRRAPADRARTGPRCRASTRSGPPRTRRASHLTSDDRRAAAPCWAIPIACSRSSGTCWRTRSSSRRPAAGCISRSIGRDRRRRSRSPTRAKASHRSCSLTSSIDSGRATHPSTRPHGGLGLGLSIVRHIVELHGGQVHASSEGPGKGAAFSVMLPIRAVRAASQSKGRGRSSAQRSPGSRGRRRRRCA